VAASNLGFVRGEKS